jgi:predicted ATPase/DNA-binding SARP family transcriptional activator
MPARQHQDPQHSEHPGLQAQLLGDLQLRYQGRAIPESAFRRRRALTLLLALLLAPGRQLPREVLLERLWPEGDPGGGADNLHSVVSALRAALGGGAHAAAIQSRGGCVALAPDLPVELDVTVFEAAAAAALERGDRSALAAVAALYRGPLLPGLPYEDWVEPRRESLTRMYRRVLAALAVAEAVGDPAAAEERLRALLASEPTNEVAARRLMRLLGARGERTEALRVFERLRRALREELDLAPSQKTLDLYAALRVQQHEPPEDTGAETAPQVPATRVLPAGNLTFLITEVEESAAFWERHPDAMQHALVRHDRIAREVLPHHEGHEVKERGAGDCIVAVFTSAAAALAAACAMQQALLHERWPAETPLRVRMGLHTGEATPREGSYRGATVNRAAGIRSLAHGGQILLSQATHDLLREGLPERVGLRSLGAHVLSGLERPEEIYQVCHPRLPSAFPPLLGPPVLKHNLPHQIDSFIGRGGAQVEVVELLSHAALVTLTGTGGVGKTRLALAVAETVLQTYADGVWVVELAALGDPAMVPATVMATLGLREEPGRPLLETLAEYLRDKHLLLLLDNCEHLVEASAALVATLLRTAARLQVLATSREALAVAGEAHYRVPPLGVPNLEALPPIELLPAYDAVRLFMERARARGHAIELNEQRAAAVAAICARLDGVPLAIELAATRLDLLSVVDLAARMDDRFRLLTAGNRAALPRHQTLRAVLDWSYQPLGAAEQQLLRLLAVFAGGWSLEAAELVGADGDLDVLSALSDLVHKSLVQAQATDDGGMRFHLLETVRQYALEQLKVEGEERTGRERHLRWCLTLLERAAPALRGAEPGPWLSRLTLEHDNMRAALAWCVADDGGITAGMQLAGALSAFWRIRGHWMEGRRWLATVLAREGGDPRARLLALAGQANLAREQWDLVESRRTQEERLALARALGDASSTQAALLGLAALVTQDPAEFVHATALAEEGLALARAAGDARGMAEALATLGRVANLQQDNRRAVPLLEESLEQYRALGDRLKIVYTQLNLAICVHALGDQQRAYDLHLALLPLCEELEDAQAMAAVHSELGRLAFERGDHAEAIAHLRNSLRGFWALGNRGALVEVLEHIAAVAAAWGQPADGIRLLGAADAILRAIGLPADDYAQLVPNLAQVRQQLGERRYAAALAAGQSLPIEQAVDEAETLCMALLRDSRPRGYSVLGRAGSRLPDE